MPTGNMSSLSLYTSFYYNEPKFIAFYLQIYKSTKNSFLSPFQFNKIMPKSLQSLRKHPILLQDSFSQLWSTNPSVKKVRIFGLHDCCVNCLIVEYRVNGDDIEQGHSSELLLR